MPGAEQETGAQVAFDIISSRIVESLPDCVNHPDAIQTTEDTEFPVDFPLSDIILALNRGTIFPERYRENGLEVEEVTLNEEETVWRTDLLQLDLSDESLAYLLILLETQK